VSPSFQCRPRLELPRRSRSAPLPGSRSQVPDVAHGAERPRSPATIFLGKQGNTICHNLYLYIYIINLNIYIHVYIYASMYVFYILNIYICIHTDIYCICLCILCVSVVSCLFLFILRTLYWSIYLIIDIMYLSNQIMPILSHHARPGMIQTCLGQVSKNGTGHSAIFYEGTCNEKPWALMDFGFPPCLNKPTSLPLAASWERFPNSTSTQGLSEAIKVVVASQHPPGGTLGIHDIQSLCCKEEESPQPAW
jgi:hypothetical protein